MDELRGPVLRCKLQVISVSDSVDNDGTKSQERVQLMAVYSDDPASENRQWSKWTPSANFEMYINNPSAFGKLKQGEEYFVDLTPASTEPQKAAA
ncbi:MAG TPA: hypothetical protein VEF04_01890 [Blastocatellia bacterium]|nr:hypothetical protein [Blastocatellia bacterium]